VGIAALEGDLTAGANIGADYHRVCNLLKAFKRLFKGLLKAFERPLKKPLKGLYRPLKGLRKPFSSGL